MNPQYVVFHYRDGTTVELGDKVRTGNGNLGEIVCIMQPGSDDALAYDCEEEGGILIRESWNGVDSHMVEQPPDGPSWEDLTFLERSKPESGQ